MGTVGAESNSAKASSGGIVTGTIGGPCKSIRRRPDSVGPWAALLIGAVARYHCVQEAVVLIRTRSKSTTRLDVFRCARGWWVLFGTIMIAALVRARDRAAGVRLVLLGLSTMVRRAGAGLQGDPPLRVSKRG